MTQATFYHRKARRKLSKAFLMSRYYICERCGKPAVIAHHKIHLTAANITDPNIALNPDNLEALCMDCHNAEHFGGGGATVAGMRFDQNGDIIPQNQRNEGMYYE